MELLNRLAGLVEMAGGAYGALFLGSVGEHRFEQLMDRAIERFHPFSGRASSQMAQSVPRIMMLFRRLSCGGVLFAVGSALILPTLLGIGIGASVMADGGSRLFHGTSIFERGGLLCFLAHGEHSKP